MIRETATPVGKGDGTLHRLIDIFSVVFGMYSQFQTTLGDLSVQKLEYGKLLDYGELEN